MKKTLFIAFALVASVLVFNACEKNNRANEPEESEKTGKTDDSGKAGNDSTATNTDADLFKGARFGNDYIDDNHNYNRLDFIFGQKNDFEWYSDCYADDSTRTTLFARMYNVGTYVLQKAESQIIFHYTDGYYISNAIVGDTTMTGPLHSDDTCSYVFHGDSLSLTFLREGNSVTLKKQ